MHIKLNKLEHTKHLNKDSVSYKNTKNRRNIQFSYREAVHFEGNLNVLKENYIFLGFCMFSIIQFNFHLR